jgi:hypothetical protein
VKVAALERLRACAGYAAIAVVSFGLIGVGLILQHGLDLEP